MAALRRPDLRCAAVLFGAVALALMFESQVLACATCFGDPNSLQTKGMNQAILFLLGLVATVLASFAGLFGYWMIRHRRNSLAESGATQ